jgi:selenide,water dikinase
LSDIPQVENERVIATWSGGEDAALWTIDIDGARPRVGILTVDFITPVVDDPYVWGQVAAANSISDVFAMGGRPLVALNVVAFPTRALGLDVLKKVIEGGFSKVREAGAVLAGGHSIRDDEPKYGLVVYGEAEADSVWRTTGAADGDVLILTKPIGTGVAITAIKAGILSASGGVKENHTLSETLRWMTALNSLNLTPDLRRAVHAATDVTGFGLVGHTMDMLSGGGLDVHMKFMDVPLLSGVLEPAEMGMIPGGVESNKVAYGDRVVMNARRSDSSPLADFEEAMLYDTQTSGGLLLAVQPERAEEVLAACRESGFDLSAAIGVFQKGSGRLVVE